MGFQVGEQVLPAVLGALSFIGEQRLPANKLGASHSECILHLGDGGAISTGYGRIGPQA
jgi:hypothetical protein